MGLSVCLEENIAELQKLLPVGKSFDIVTRRMTLCGVDAYWIGINGMCKTDILQKLFGYLQNPAYLEMQSEFSGRDGELLESVQRFIASKIGYVQTELCDDWDAICKNIVSGPTALFLNGCAQAGRRDVRTYPTRGIEDPVGYLASHNERVIINFPCFQFVGALFSRAIEEGTIRFNGPNPLK